MMYLYGASGHAKVIIEILVSQGITVKGLFDDDTSKQRLWQYPVTVLPADFNSGTDEVIIAIGSNAIRKKLAEKAAARFGLAVHTRATVSPTATLDGGTVVMAGATINADAVIGRHCIINTNASVDHDCVLGDYVHISPHATLCGDVKIGEGTQIGAGAVVIPGITIGRWAVIGAGAVVIRDIPDQVTVVGNPARILKNI
ncbi:acetyltransferase [Chitinophaga nivalis]|uniref:Acetyltransferase n=1 Tax=Chitinophaga nivalis TaxID=2991709 RepID=A0ABT3INU2_9BACT|nr:acetyltransferase [Chitinophaga nivalis]MCW3464672.1 acetyltransferase [Chitinophaga nivalis]MCW3485637.1 acetyltransferase [Chitinophaga nivalis]